MSNIYELQNGTDIRGIAYKNDKRNVNLTNKEIGKIAQAFYIWLKNKLKKDIITISVGCDSRITGQEFKSTFIENLLELGSSIIDCNMATTPAMFMTTVMDDYMCDGAVMITASHLPYYYNGIKFFTKDGGLEKNDIKEILDIYNMDQKLIAKSQHGSVSNKDLIKDYSKILVNKIRKGVNSSKDYNHPLKGLNIIVDAGNGSGGFFVEDVLLELGANTNGSQYLNPDGMFPNHIPNPENSEAMKSICEAVKVNKSHIGIIFDTDVDRAGLVDRNGEPINKNSLIALISSIILEEHPNTTIVTDSITSEGLTKFIEDLNGKHHRFKRGYKNVINEAIRLNDEGEGCYLAIETSGHAALKENYFLDDGAYLISKILIKVAQLQEVGKGIEELISDLEHAKEEREIRIRIEVEDYKGYAEGILDNLKKHIKKSLGWKEVDENYEGIRVNCDKDSGDGWFLLRLSLHEPLLALNIESNTVGGVDIILNILKDFFKIYKLKDI